MGDRYLKILMGTFKCCFQLENFFFKKIVEGGEDVGRIIICSFLNWLERILFGG